MTFGISKKQFLAETPKLAKQLGNALISIGAATAVPAALSDNKTVGACLLVAGALGKLITSFCGPDEPAQPNS